MVDTLFRTSIIESLNREVPETAQVDPDEMFEHFVIPRLREGSLPPEVVNKLYHYLQVQRHPKEGETIKGIIVMGTDPKRFRVSALARIEIAMKLARDYPNAPVIFSGRGQPGQDVVLPEAIEMRDMAIHDGLEPKRAIPEWRSTTSQQNIAMSRELLNTRFNINDSIATVGAGFSGRRNMLYGEAAINAGLLLPPFFVYSAVIPMEPEKQAANAAREFQSLIEYRRLGHL